MGNVIELFEKKKIGNEAIVGIYLFKNFSDYLKTCLDLLIKYKGFKNKVFYNSDVINSLMQNQKVKFPILKLQYFKIKSVKTLKKAL